MYDRKKERGGSSGVRIFKDKRFSRYARRHGLNDQILCEAIARAQRGLVDADLGGGVIKQRVARPNAGRSGGYRTIIFFHIDERAFFVFGFAKNEMDNISPDDLKAFRRAAEITLALDDNQLQVLMDAEELIEVHCDAENL
jgi:hypothetical protein